LDGAEHKRGGFIKRENIKNAAWFKLGSGLWKRNTLIEEVRPEDVLGLLFVNSRKKKYDPEELASVKVKEVLAAIADILPEVIDERERHRHYRVYRLVIKLNQSGEINKVTAKDLGNCDQKMVLGIPLHGYKPKKLQFL
jgi:hypothetical protein